MKEILYRFGPFEFNPAERTLRRSGVLVPITPKALATLQILVAADGRVVAKEDLLRELWPDSFVEDGNLTQHISALRKVFASDFPDASPIDTLSRVGYRFVTPVEQIQIEATLGSTHTTPSIDIGRDTPKNAPESPPPAPLKRRKSFLWAWAFAVLIMVMGLGVLLHKQIRDKFPSNRSVTLTRFTTKSTEDRVTVAAISPDGRLMAYADADGVILQAIGDPATHLLHAPAMTKITHLAWFPNGLHLVLSGVEAASGEPQAWILSVVGDAPALLRQDAALAVPSPDGTLVAFTSGSGSEVWVAGPAGEGARRLIAGLPNAVFSALLWTRNSLTILLQEKTYVAQRSLFPPGSQEDVHGFKATYLGLNAATGQKTTSLAGMRFEDACLLKEDRLFFSRTEPTSTYNGATTLWTVPVDPATGAFRAEPEKLKELSDFRVTALTIAQNGEIGAIFSQGWPQVYEGDLHRSPFMIDNVKRLSFDAGIAYPHSWSADSKSVFYESDHYGRYQIYKQQIDRHDPEAVAITTEIQSRPRLSPDHRWLLFLSAPEKRAPASLYRVSTEGGGPVRVNIAGPVNDYRCPLAGKVCVMLTMDEQHQAVFTAFDPVEGKGAELFRAPPGLSRITDWDLSPEGSTLAIIPANSPRRQIQTVRFASKQIQQLPVDMVTPILTLNWAADGNGWFVSTSSSPGTELLYVDTRGRSTPLRRMIGTTWAIPSPDGRKLAFVDENMDSNVWLLHPSE